MVSGTYQWYFWASVAFVAVGIVAPFGGGILLAPAPLLGLIAYEHAYVQAGQAVPLA
jgi:hypothetical protein